jgi:acyl-homoserine lactone acylase PvdQ
MTKWTSPVGTDQHGDLGETPKTLARGTYTMQVSIESGFPGARSVLFPGNVEDPDSPHHADQFPLYRDRAFKPMPFTNADIRKYAESEITLRYTPQ